MTATVPVAAAPTGPLAIDARGVRKVFGTGAIAFEALRGVDFSVARGEFLMLVGPSGSGKTTLLSILGCVLTATTGDVMLFGHRVTGRRERELPAIRRALIGFVFQGTNLIGALPAIDNVRLVLETRGHSRSDATAEATTLLQRVGLGDRLWARPAELSGGQLQRVAIARAVAGTPPLVLADEPTAALDAQTGQEATQLLLDVCRERGSTVVIVTHDPRIFHLAERIVRIEDGRIVSTADPPNAPSSEALTEARPDSRPGAPP